MDSARPSLSTMREVLFVTIFISFVLIICVSVVVEQRIMDVSRRTQRNRLRRHVNPREIMSHEYLKKTLQQARNVIVEQQQKMCERTLVPPHSDKITYYNYLWQRLENAAVFLYSSYYDDRPQQHLRRAVSNVRIIGISKEDPLVLNSRKLYCMLWYSEYKAPVIVEAKITSMWAQRSENSKMGRFEPVLLTCTVPSKMPKKYVPKFVTVATARCSVPSTLLPIRIHKANTTEETDLKPFAVCTDNPRLNKDVSSQFTEWIELLLILGASKISLYLYDILHPNVKTVLNYYVEQGVVDTILMSIPDEGHILGKSNVSAYYKQRNEIVSHTDCLYRNMYRFKHILPLDMNEIVVPKIKGTWKDILDTADNDLADTDGFLGLSTFFVIPTVANFFPMSKRDVNNETDIPAYFFMLMQTARSNDVVSAVHPKVSSVRGFTSTEKANIVFNYFDKNRISEQPHIRYLSENKVQMNHYNEVQCEDIHFQKMVEDKSLQMKYKEILIPRVTKVLKKLNLLL